MNACKVFEVQPERQHLSDIELDLESRYVGEKRKMGWTDDGFRLATARTHGSYLPRQAFDTTQPTPHLLRDIFTTTNYAIQCSVIKKKEDDSWYSKNHMKYLLHSVYPTTT